LQLFLHCHSSWPASFGSKQPISGIGQKKAWKEHQRTASANQEIGQLDDALPPSEQTVSAIDKYICSIYSKSTKARTQADETRYWMFCQKKQTKKSLQCKEDPLKTDSLIQHIEKANFLQLSTVNNCIE